MGRVIRHEELDIRRPRSRFIDELQAELGRRTIVLAADVKASPMFGDICWDPMPSMREAASDPVLVFIGFTRWVALGRYFGEVRFYAGPIGQGMYPWWWDGSQPARRAAIEAEPWDQLIAIFESVEDAATYLERYLRGASHGELMSLWRRRRKGYRRLAAG